MKPHCLSLFDHSGNWSAPWLASHTVETVDLKHGQDVLNYRVRRRADVVLAAPCCTVWSGAGAWVSRTEKEFLHALALVAAVGRIIREAEPRVWCLENPRGFLTRILGEPQAKFQPWEFGDAKSKETWLWGKFNNPLPLLHGPGYFGKAGNEWMMRLGGKSERTKELRSVTPAGFALAFYRANVV